MNIVEYLKRQTANKNLTSSEVYFLDWILNNLETMSWHESISSLSRRVSLSQSSITKFFNKIGINGYKGFCMHITNSKDQPQVEDPVIKSLLKTINVLRKSHVQKSVNELASLIVQKKKVSLIASNFSYVAAIKLQRELRTVGVSVNLYDSKEDVPISEDDSIKIFVSSTGRSKALTNTFAQVKSFDSKQHTFIVTSSYICSIKSKADGHIHGYVVLDKTKTVTKEHSLIKWTVLNYCLDHIFLKVTKAIKGTIYEDD